MELPLEVLIHKQTVRLLTRLSSVYEVKQGFDQIPRTTRASRLSRVEEDTSVLWQSNEVVHSNAYLVCSKRRSLCRMNDLELDREIHRMEPRSRQAGTAGDASLA